MAPSETIRKVLGHTTSAMTAHYNSPDMDAKRGVLGQVVQLVRAASDTTTPERGDEVGGSKKAEEATSRFPGDSQRPRRESNAGPTV